MQQDFGGEMGYKTMKLKKDYSISKEQQTIQAIKSLIKRGRLMEGDQLPPISELSQSFGVSKNIVSQALEYLSYQGLVVTRPRLGTFVARNSIFNGKKFSWKDLIKNNAYNPRNRKLFDIFSHLDDDAKTPHLSGVSVSDGIYSDLLINAQKQVNVTLKSTASNELELFSNAGLFSLKEQLALHMGKYGMDVDPRQIVVCSHIQNAFNLIATLLLAPDSTLIHEVPGITHHRSYIQTLGAQSIGIEFEPDGVNTSQLIETIKNNPGSVLTTTPLYSYPTGNCATLEKKKAVLTICNNSETPIIEIDEYRCFDFEAPETYYSLNQGNGVIYLGSLSRTLPFGFALCWIVLPYSLIHPVLELKQQMYWGPNNYVQMIVKTILSDGSYYNYLKKLKKHIAKREIRVREIIHKHLHDICTIDEDKHPMAFWVELPFKSDLLLFNKKVNVTPGSICTHNKDNHIIISKTYPSIDHYEAVVIKLREAILEILSTTTEKNDKLNHITLPKVARGFFDI